MSQLVDFLRRVLPRARDEGAASHIQPPPIEPKDLEASISLDPTKFDPDHPISPGYKDDRLGFRSVAGMLASSLLTQATSRGLVVSIEGVWGSGKSSLVSLLEHELKAGTSAPPQIVRFEPWLVGGRDGMLMELMSDLATAVELLEAPRRSRGNKVKEQTKTLAAKLRGYGATLSRRSAPLARFAGSVGLPGGHLAAEGLEAASDLLGRNGSERSLSDSKSDLIEGLNGLDRRIVVIVDDLDRLEPRESAEITRLIRAVADFPNIIYVLCYDPTILAANLSKAVSVDDGAAFLEKIVQVRFKVPQPEAFDLRRWLLEECMLFYQSMSDMELSDDKRQRLYFVCDIEGQLLKTPRDVARTVNAIRLHWPPIAEKVDYADLVWLQMVRMRSESLYDWIENYMAEYAAFLDGSTIEDGRRENLAKKLRENLPDTSFGARSFWTFQRFVPGIRPGDSVDDKQRLFNRESESAVSAHERERRLASRHHCRYYFAFSKSSGALDDSELQRFILLAKDGVDIEGVCMDLIGAKRAQGGSKFDMLMDRLNRLDDASLPVESVPSILMALANCMDKAGLEGGKGRWGVRWSWDSAENLFKKLLKRLDDDDRTKIISDAFGSGKAIGWLMSELIRRETYAKKQEDDRFLSDIELNKARKLLIARFKSHERAELVNAPELLSLMYGWKEADDEAGVLEWVREQQASDAGFLALLSACRGWLQSDKTYYPLNRRDLKNFLDFDEALGRLRRIVESTDSTGSDRAMANELLAAAELGKDD